MSDAGAPQASPKGPRSPYIVNALVDGLFLGGGSILLFALCAPFLWRKAESPDIYRVTAMLSWIVNHPHFAATSYRLFRSRDYMKQYPLTTLAVPLVVLGWVVASLLDPVHIAPVFIRLYILWSPYHFCGQSIGLTLLYARRAGVEVTALERYSIMGFIYGTFVSTQAAIETGVVQPYFTVPIPALYLPAWVGDVTMVAMYACAALFLGSLVARALRGQRQWHLFALIPMLTQFVWYVPGPKVPYWYQFVPFFHSLQYLYIAWAVQLKEVCDESGARPSWDFALGETWRWALVSFIGGALQFIWIPILLTSLLALPQGLVEAVFTAGVQIHHFFVDGVIWKLKNPRALSPLMVRVEDFIRGPVQAGVT